MNGFFLKLEQAEELKSMGFNQPCLASWNLFTSELNYNGFPSDFSNENVFQLPLYSQAFSWLREKYGLNSFVYSSGVNEYNYNIDDNYWVHCKTYEEAELECLKKLIEIVKNK